jgi:hypothetical protein
MAGDIAEYLDKVWHAEGGNGNAPDFARLSNAAITYVTVWGDWK